MPRVAQHMDGLPTAAGPSLCLSALSPCRELFPLVFLFNPEPQKCTEANEGGECRNQMSTEE